MFPPYIIVMYESLNCPQCEKMDSKGFKYAEDAGKPKNVQDTEDFPDEQQVVELLRTNEGLMNNYHKI